MSKKRKKYKQPKKVKIGVKRKLLLLLAGVVLLFLIYGISLAVRVALLPDAPKDNLDYAVRGIDVSSYQGDIHWPTLSSQGMSFVFIKATEGSSHKDPKFDHNWEEVRKTRLRVGAYHFMSFETPGETQAENFIRTVGKTGGDLPPVVDVELYGDFITSSPTEEQVHGILAPMLVALEEEYGKEPIIYTTTHLYMKYISGNYDNDIWIADPGLTPKLPDGKDWVFCQYSFEGVLKGYKGPVPHIDLNVFKGSKMDFVRY